MMEPGEPSALNMESKEPISKVDIVKEVASALEEEDFTKEGSKTATKVAPTNTRTTALPYQQPAVTTQLPKLTASNVSQSISSSNTVVPASPPQERIRSEPAPSQKGPQTGDSSTASTSTTWQKPQTEESGGGMWGWMSNAVSAGLQTTQNIGRNIVEKTKVPTCIVC